MRAVYVTVGVCVSVCGWVGGCADGSWEADTVQENRPLATDLFFFWQMALPEQQPPSITMAVAS